MIRADALKLHPTGRIVPVDGFRSAQRWLRGRGDLVATVVVLLAMIPADLSPHGRHGSLPSGYVVLLVVVAAALPFRLRRPLLIAGVVVAGEAALMAWGASSTPHWSIAPVGTQLVLYTLGNRFPTRTVWPLAVVAAAVQSVALSVHNPRQAVVVACVCWVAASTLFGQLVRERRERVAAAEARARAAEQRHVAEAARQVSAERLRIAQDLHDVLAHHIALVNAKAGVAQYLLRTDLEAADLALDGIASHTRSALDDLRSTLGLLRAGTSESFGTESRAPVPTSRDLDDLFERLHVAGLPLSVETVGTAAPLSPAADTALYRVVQEALTNASKHAPGGRVRVDLRWTDRDVAVRVVSERVDAVTTPAPDGSAGRGTGHGLLGMRERATTAGGTFRTSIGPGGSFVVDVHLPLARSEP